MSDSFRPHGLQHARPPDVYPSSCPSCHWCHPTISSSVIPFFCPQSFPASGYFPMSWFFESGGQSIGVSVLASVFPMNTQDWSPLGWTGWISLQFRDSQEFSPTPQFRSITWRREWQTTSVFLSWEPHEQYEKVKRDDISLLKTHLKKALMKENKRWKIAGQLFCF